MPYPAGHRTEVRGKIVQSARRLFNRHGFDNVSLTQIMAGAGLTHGGFYSYFNSKSDLYTEVLGCFFTDPEWKSCWEGVEVDLSSSDVGSQVIRAYLSRQHFEDVENSCPMVALPTDVSRRGESAKRAFETVFQAMVSVLERSSLRMAGLATPRLRPPLLCVSEGWSWLGLWSTALLQMNCATRAWTSHSNSAAGISRANRKTEDPSALNRSAGQRRRCSSPSLVTPIPLGRSGNPARLQVAP